MKNISLGKLLLATCIVATTAAHSNAQGIRASQLLAGNTSCIHVIRLIQIHGVNNSFDMGGSHLSAHLSPFGAYAVPDNELGDLEIVQVAQEQVVDAACGPRIHVTIRNNSCRDVCSFHVTLVATLGRIFPGSPHATTSVEKICAGANVDVCVQLPVEALAMGNNNGQPVGFQTLVVAIDAFDELAETNEANNLKAFACGEIPVMTASVVEETAVVSEAATVQQVDSANVDPAGVGQTAAPAATVPDATVEEGTEGEDPLRSAIQMLDQPSEEESTAIATN